MKKTKRNAFTLIELIGVLVIMAILALIVTPLVMNIIRRARVSADKRSIDAYGRSIELAVASYLLDNGKFPTTLDQLTIEYSGNQVVCETTQLNSDSSVYLTGCRVGGRNVDYTYGENKTPPAPTYTAYSVGDEVSYNNVDYYVIADSGTTESTVKLLKKLPLSYDEVQTYSAGTGASVGCVDYIDTQYIECGFGIMDYGNNNVYSTSYIKTTIDAWAEVKVPSGLQEARLLTVDELINLGYSDEDFFLAINDEVPFWLIDPYAMYSQWTMTPGEDDSKVWYIDTEAGVYADADVVSWREVVRPVIILSKSSIAA